MILRVDYFAMHKRFFILLFTFLSLFQSVGWSMSMDSMSMKLDTKAVEIDHQLEMHKGHAQMQIAAQDKMQCDSAMLSMQHISCDDLNEEMRGQCQLDCQTTCSANIGIDASAVYYKQVPFKRYFSRAATTSFPSLTESPEIQPPLNIRT